MAAEEHKPLRGIADSFESLAETVVSKSAPMEVAYFSDACSRVSFLFGCLGIAFKFAEKDYVSKVEDLKEAGKSISTLQSMLELDIKSDCVRHGGSHSRNLLRVKRGIDMVKVLFEEILASRSIMWCFGFPSWKRCYRVKISYGGNSLKDPASVAYSKVFAVHHGWAIRKAVGAGMYALPSRSQLLKKLNEDEESARIQMRRYIASSAVVIRYVEELFVVHELGIDW